MNLVRKTRMSLGDEANKVMLTKVRLRGTWRMRNFCDRLALHWTDAPGACLPNACTVRELALRSSCDNFKILASKDLVATCLMTHPMQKGMVCIGS